MEKLKIVVIEDSKSMQTILVTALKKWGYEVFSADAAEQAFDIIHAESPNIIITDWMLPGMDGPTFCTKIRNLQTPNYIYLIIITALTDNSNVITGLEAGADDFLRKPINFKELRVRLVAGNRIIKLEETLRNKNAQLSAIGNKLNQLNTELLAAQNKIRQDLKFAEKIQCNLLPKNNLQFKNLVFHYLYCPSLHVSGDILNYFQVNTEILCFYAIDVCGHGIASAMLSYSISKIITQSIDFNSCAKNFRNNMGLFDNPHQFVDYLNSIFYTNNDYSLYFSIIFGFINTRIQTVSFCQAGHPHPIYQRQGCAPELLGNGGFPVALLPTPIYDSITLSFQPGDKLFVYSDGVTDCNNGSGGIFDTKNLLAFLEQNQSYSLNQIFAEFKNKLVDWHGSEQFDDDVSILGIEFI